VQQTISNRQMFFILLLTLTSYSVVDISKAMAQSAGTGGWLTVLAASVLFGIAAAVVVSLNRQYGGRALPAYASDIAGRGLGTLVRIYYICYFLLIAVFLVMQMGTLLRMDFFPKTPVWAIMLASVPVFGYIAYKGVHTMARMFEFLGIIYLITAISVHVLMATQGKPERILPLFNAADTGRYLAAIWPAAFSFLGIEVLLIMPMAQKTQSKGARAAFWSVVAIGFFYVLIIESSIMKLGINDIVNYNDSLIVAIRDLSLPFLDFFERIDILFLTIGFLGFYLGISVVFTALTEFLCSMFPRAKRTVVVIALGAAVFALCLAAQAAQGFTEAVVSVGTYLGIAACLVLPLALKIAARAKNHGA